jgi:TRAP-type C4-dicarboxylate transport system permease small subunit
MARIGHWLGCLFGYLFLALALLVTAETLARKLFNFSLQGADELGGYALAVGSSLAFSVALIERSHIRIDLLAQRLPGSVQAFLNWLAVVSIAGFGVLLAWVGHGIITETMAFRSTAPTPWATPLIYPQGLWYGALLVFAVLAVWLALRASLLLARGEWRELNIEFQARSAMEELAEEIDDVERR